MKTQITRTLGSLAIAAALLTTSTAAFAATPASTSPSLYDEAAEAGDDVAGGLDVGGAALGIGSAVVGAAAGSTEAGQDVSGGLTVGGAVLTEVAAPVVRIATH